MLREHKTKTATSNPEYIRLSDVRADDNKLVTRLNVSADVKKYFLRDNLVIEYDKNIEDVDESLLVIPALYAIAPVAWAAGADIYVEKLDQTCLNSLQKIKHIFKEWYPKFSFSGNIHVRNLVRNEFGGRQTALLFSGGVDSTTSYVRHKDECPILITLLKGENPYSYENEYYDRVRNNIVSFAKNEGTSTHFIKTDLWDTYSNFLKNQLLAREFGVIDWWMNVTYGLVSVGLCAPLTFGRIGVLYIASSYDRNYKLTMGDGSHFIADTNVSWADVRVQYDADELTRQKKIKYLIQKNKSYLKNLRVCGPINLGHNKNSDPRAYFRNCGSCEKCLRTITGLILEGVEPRECNFDLNDKVLDYVRCLLNDGIFDLRINEGDDWKSIQSYIPDTIDDIGVIQRYRAKQFFEWFRDFDFADYRFIGRGRLRMIHWAYELVKYRGVYETARVVTECLKRNPTSF